MEIVVTLIAIALAVSCLFFATHSDLVDRLRRKLNKSADESNDKNDP